MGTNREDRGSVGHVRARRLVDTYRTTVSMLKNKTAHAYTRVRYLMSPVVSRLLYTSFPLVSSYRG